MNENLADIRQFKIMTRFSQDFVVKFHHAWLEDKEFMYILMELCQDNMNNVLRLKPQAFGRKDTEPMCMLEYQLSGHMLMDMTKTIVHLHTHQPPIIHRDIKPSNILVSIIGNRICLKLCDFGMAKEHDKSSHTGNQGTWRWMAPEVHKGRHYNLKADIYSLAVIGIQMFGFDLDKISKRKYMD